MATRIAQANTINNNVWSSTLTWIGGTVPLPGDDVVANGITVNVNGTFSVNTLRNDTALGGVAGGTFVLANGSALTTTASTGLFVPQASQTPVLTFNLPSGQSASYNGSVLTMPYQGIITGFGTRLIQYSNTGTFNITGNFNVDNGTTNIQKSCILITGTGTVNIVGNLTNTCTPTSGVNNQHAALYIAGTATININSILIVGGNIASLACPAIYMQAAANLIITSTVISSVEGSTAPAIFMSAGGTCNITATTITGGGGTIATIQNQTIGTPITIAGLVTAGAGARVVNSLSSVTVTGAVNTPALGTVPAISTTSSVIIDGNVTNNGNGGAITCTGNATVTGNVITNGNSVGLSCGGLATINGLIFNNQQFQGVYAPRILIGTATTAMRYQTFAGTTQLMFSSSAITLGQPLPNNVRLGTSYGLAPNDFVGTCIIPNPNTVVVGAPTDNTVGTLQMSPAAVVAELGTSTLDIAVRLQNVSTVQTMGAQAATYGI